MNKQALRKKISDLQQQLKSLKRQISEQPDFEIDEENWNELKREVKKIREENFEKEYGE